MRRAAWARLAVLAASWVAMRAVGLAVARAGVMEALMVGAMVV